MAMTKATGRFKEVPVLDVPDGLRALYAVKGRTITRAATRGTGAGAEWRLTSDSGLTVEWTFWGHMGQPWKAKVKK